MKRLTTGEKHQLADPGFVAALLGVNEAHLLSGAPGTAETFGRLFESLCTLGVRAAAEACEAKVYHVRTRRGDQKIDILAERYDGKVVAFEVKLARNISDTDVQHLNWLANHIGERLAAKVVLNTGRFAYTRPDGVHIIPLAMFGSIPLLHARGA